MVDESNLREMSDNDWQGLEIPLGVVQRIKRMVRLEEEEKKEMTNPYEEVKQEEK